MNAYGDTLAVFASIPRLVVLLSTMLLSTMLLLGTGCQVTLPVAPAALQGESETPADDGIWDVPDRRLSDAPNRRLSDAPERNLGDGPNRNLAQGPERNLGDGPDRNAGAGPEREPGQGPDRRVGQGPKRLPGKGPGRNGGHGPDRQPGKGPAASRGRRPDLELYAGDPRWPAFAATWFDRIERAFDRLDVVTGLDFADTTRPRVVLRAFRDETRTHELRAEVLEGRRRVVVHVNSEPLVAGVRDADRVLLRALTDAAFQDAIHRHGPVPRWFVELASLVAAGDTDVRLVALYRRAVRDGEAVLHIDPDDPKAATTSGLAALTLLTSRGEPRAVRRAIGFVADGDPAGEVLGRLIGEAGGGWVETARTALGQRLALVDPAPWALLVEAEDALAETGRAGLEAVVPAEPAIEIADELRVLRARAALTEGDHAAAREALRSLSDEAMRRVRDPAAMMALRVNVESRSGGDARLARRLARRLDRDFPRDASTRAVSDAHPLLGIEEDPQRWLARMRDRLARDGDASFDLDTLARYVRMLVMDHRAGAAERVLETFGPRGAAPELEEIRDTVLEAQSAPSGAGLARGQTRVAVWQTDKTDAHARDVHETGRAAAPALLAAIRVPSAAAGRTALIQLLARTVAEEEAVDAVRALWPGNPGRIHRDLQALGGVVAYPALERVLAADDLGEAEAQALAKAWARLTLGLSRRWLSMQPTFLRSLHHPEFTVRRAAFEQIGTEAPGEITPSLVAIGLKDRAALLRREATVLAALAGFPALARRALVDEAWVVREEAVRSVVRLEGRTCLGVLLRLVREDPSREVRAAAALALIRTAPADPRAIDGLLASQVGEEARLRDAIGARLAEVEPQPVVAGIVRGWRRAMARKAPDPGYLFRTALLYGRLTKQGIGYYPGATRAEMRAMLATMEAWLAARAAVAPAGEAPGGKTPAGRGR